MARKEGRPMKLRDVPNIEKILKRTRFTISLDDEEPGRALCCVESSFLARVFGRNYLDEPLTLETFMKLFRPKEIE